VVLDLSVESRQRFGAALRISFEPSAVLHLQRQSQAC
jgi:hypothetical protein